MTNEEIRAAHPRRAGVGDAIRLLIPLSEPDSETRQELKMARRIDHVKALK